MSNMGPFPDSPVSVVGYLIAAFDLGDLLTYRILLAAVKAVSAARTSPIVQFPRTVELGPEAARRAQGPYASRRAAIFSAARMQPSIFRCRLFTRL